MIKNQKKKKKKKKKRKKKKKKGKKERITQEEIILRNGFLPYQIHFDFLTNKKSTKSDSLAMKLQNIYCPLNNHFELA